MENKQSKLPNLTEKEWELIKEQVSIDDEYYDSFISQGITADDLERLIINKNKQPNP